MTDTDIRSAILNFFRQNIVFNDKWLIADDASFLSTGTLDSTGILELIGFLEERYGLRFRDDELVASNFDSLRRVSEFMTQRLNASHHS